MKNAETVKLMAETLKDSLSKFVGQTNNESTVKEVKAHMTSVLMSLMNTMGSSAPLPNIEVTMKGSEAFFDFYDPKTGDKIAVGDWISRAIEGYYD